MIDKVFEYIRENKDILINELCGLIRIPSEKGERTESCPFGEEVDRAYSYMLGLAEKDGFSVFDADRYGGHIDFRGRGGEVMGIAGHLDVVPAGNGWDHDPYGAEIDDGRIFGRGTTDDKGPVMASYFAMRALKECGFEPEKTVRLILGLDEETDWYGMDYYLSMTERPDFGFTPDGNFPAIQGEKGIMVFDIAQKFGRGTGDGLRLRHVKGGNAANMVPDHAKALVLGSREDYEKIKEKAALFRKEKGYDIAVRQAGKSLEIKAAGKSAHGANPDAGLNAVSVLMAFLGTIVFANDDVNSFVEFYNNHIGFETDGTGMGCGFEDAPSGKLVFNAGVVEISEKAAALTCNVRYPVTLKAEDVYEGMSPLLAEHNMGVIKKAHQYPIYLTSDDTILKTLVRVYRERTGDMESVPLVIGGGTYSRAFDNMIAYGAEFPGDEELMHQKNEYIETERLVKLAEIYAQAIYELAK